MTLDALIDWVDAAMIRARAMSPGVDVGHVERLYVRLRPVGARWDLRSEWHRLAKKLARLLNCPPPDKATTRSAESEGLEPAPRKKRRRGEDWVGEGEARPRRRRLATKTPPPVIQMNAQLQAAFDAVTSGKPIVFVTGGAGTGKSTFIRELRHRLQDKNSIVLAPTGVAALNAGGQTIHSFCRLPLRPFMPGDAVKSRDPELVEALDVLIIDEISMVRADILDGVDAFLRLNRKSDAPFGGVQMVLVGDLFQLPPVVTSRDEMTITERYASPFFFSASALRGLRFFPVELEIVYRQRDASFASLLGAIRDGSGIATAVRQLNEVCVGRKVTGRHLILVPTRKAAAAENEARLEALKGKPRTYVAAAEGSFLSVADEQLPAPKELVLKPEAQVMFVRNDAVEKRWVNGTLGVVTALHDAKATVRLDDGESHDVEPVEWQDIRYALDPKTKKIVEEIAGTYTQLPLIPAWAVTIHKAQGLTLERVEVDLARGAFAEGQVYVALSRCQTLEGLSLRRAVRNIEVRCSAAATEFYAKMRSRRR
jgi:ATP-dependent DNA helicase PIF1